MIDFISSQSLRKQLALLQVNRSSYYYRLNHPKITSEGDITLMHLIDRIHTLSPCYGSRTIRAELTRQLGKSINRKRVQRLMRVMGIEALYQKPNLSVPDSQHPVYPYRLKGIKPQTINHIWSVDITYIPLLGSFLYLVAILDWYSRYIIAWQLSDSLEVGFCCETINQALTTNIPLIHNSDQGSQFTSLEYLAHLWQYPEIVISMDGRSRAYDNIFIERLWRTIKYEEVYLKEYSSPKEARENLTAYINYYNQRRLHQSLSYHTPAEIYFSAGR